MMKRLKYLPLLFATCCGCSSKATTDNAEAGRPATEPSVAAAQSQAVRFDADSAMTFLRRQVAPGPRVPGSQAHKVTGDYLVAELKRLGADTIIEQRVDVTAWNGDRLPLRNFLARFAPDSKGKRILLVAHWDSRPWADEEPDEALRQKPIEGANDGASGVAVLLEIARQLGIKPAAEPVDILLVDGEDYGAPDVEGGDETSWCLGTQAWIREAMPYDFSSQPRYAILLDMVGGRDARFHREAVSDYLAHDVVDRVWSRAANLGLSDRFVNERGGTVVDDHLFINQAGIPAIDIIESANPSTGSFNPTWHTHSDTADNIDPETLRAVGTLVQSIVYDR